MLNLLLSLFFPASCTSCKKPGTALCGACATQIAPSRYIDEHTYALYSYKNSIIRSAIWKLKYHHKSEVAHALFKRKSDEMVAFISESLHATMQQNIYIIPIPQYKSKSSARGYNQTHLLATWLSKIVVGSVVSDVVEKTKNTLPQAKMKNRAARLKNVEHTFICTATLDPYTLYIIVDDVITTGATMQEAKRVLKMSGAKNILSISLAHG